MGRSIIIKVIIVAILFVAYVFAVALGLPNTITGPVFFVVIAIVLFFPTKTHENSADRERSDAGPEVRR